MQKTKEYKVLKKGGSGTTPLFFYIKYFICIYNNASI